MLTESMDYSQQFTIQVRSQGRVTIPRKLRDALSLEDGDFLTLFQVGNVAVLAVKPSRTYELTNKITHLMDETGVTLAELLEDLPKIREEIFKTSSSVV